MIFNPDKYNSKVGAIVNLVLLVVLLLLCIFCDGCKTKYITQEVPVEVNHTTTTERVKIIRDTLLCRDSVFIIQNEKGEPIVQKYYNTIYRGSAGKDTIHVIDSIPKIVTKNVITTKEVEKPLSWWQKTLQYSGVVFIVGILIIIAFFIYRAKHS